MKRSATGFTRKDARKPSNQFKVKLNLTMKEKKNRIYPELNVGDEVEIFRKRKRNEKERVISWSQIIYTIENIENKLDQNSYRVEGNDRQYLRVELSRRSVKKLEVVGSFATQVAWHIVFDLRRLMFEVVCGCTT